MLISWASGGGGGGKGGGSNISFFPSSPCVKCHLYWGSVKYLYTGFTFTQILGEIFFLGTGVGGWFGGRVEGAQRGCYRFLGLRGAAGNLETGLERVSLASSL